MLYALSTVLKSGSNAPSWQPEFAHVGLNYRDYIISDKNLFRPAEVDALLADSSKAKKILKWKPKISFDDLVENMVDHDME